MIFSQMKSNKKAAAAAAFRASIPVLTGYLVLGAGFGILMTASGFGIIQSVCMSIFIYAGSLQYLAVGLLASGASLPEIALTGLAVNARHIFYGISMAEKYAGVGKIKPYLIFALTDETYSLVVAPPPVPPEQLNYFYFFVSAFDHSYWICGSAIGAAAGSLIKINTTGIDFVLTALFVTILLSFLREKKNVFSAVTGLACSILCLLVLGGDAFLIPAMILIAAVLICSKHFPFLSDAGGNGNG